MFHFIVSSPLSITIGASGGISGLFGAMIFMMHQFGALQSKGRSLVIFAGVWIVILMLTGIFMDGADGSKVSWGTHVGGFLGGLLLIKPILIMRKD